MPDTIVAIGSYEPVTEVKAAEIYTQLSRSTHAGNIFEKYMPKLIVWVILVWVIVLILRLSRYISFFAFASSSVFIIISVVAVVFTAMFLIGCTYKLVALKFEDENKTRVGIIDSHKRLVYLYEEGTIVDQNLISETISLSSSFNCNVSLGRIVIENRGVDIALEAKFEVASGNLEQMIEESLGDKVESFARVFSVMANTLINDNWKKIVAHDIYADEHHFRNETNQALIDNPNIFSNEEFKMTNCFLVLTYVPLSHQLL